MVFNNLSTFFTIFVVYFYEIYTKAGKLTLLKNPDNFMGSCGIGIIE